MPKRECGDQPHVCPDIETPVVGEVTVANHRPHNKSDNKSNHGINHGISHKNKHREKAFIQYKVKQANLYITRCFFLLIHEY